jgi:hypothetical protein
VGPPTAYLRGADLVETTSPEFATKAASSAKISGTALPAASHSVRSQRTVVHHPGPAFASVIAGPFSFFLMVPFGHVPSDPPVSGNPA